MPKRPKIDGAGIAAFLGGDGDGPIEAVDSMRGTVVPRYQPTPPSTETATVVAAGPAIPVAVVGSPAPATPLITRADTVHDVVGDNTGVTPHATDHADNAATWLADNYHGLRERGIHQTSYRLTPEQLNRIKDLIADVRRDSGIEPDMQEIARLGVLYACDDWYRRGAESLIGRYIAARAARD